MKNVNDLPNTIEWGAPGGAPSIVLDRDLCYPRPGVLEALRFIWGLGLLVTGLTPVLRALQGKETPPRCETRMGMGPTAGELREDLARELRGRKARRGGA